MSKTLLVAAAQMCSGIDPAQNLDVIAGFAKQARSEGAHYLLTPEVSVAFSENPQQLAEIAEPYEGNSAVARCAEIARENHLFLHIGSLSIALENGKFANRSVLFSPDGKVLDFYDKIHLFDAQIPDERSYRESATYDGGSRAVIAEVGAFKLGMSICYDLRFPALYAALAEAGAGLIAAPSAFTVPTGEAHWEILTRARAVETGCYVIAAAQGGTHENGRSTFGHSIIVSPWGEVLAEMPDQSSGLIFAQVGLDQITITRQRVPALANRRQFSLSVNHNGLE